MKRGSGSEAGEGHWEEKTEDGGTIWRRVTAEMSERRHVGEMIPVVLL